MTRVTRAELVEALTVERYQPIPKRPAVRDPGPLTPAELRAAGDRGPVSGVVARRRRILLGIDDEADQ